MRGKKAKALRKMVGFDPTAERKSPGELPQGMTVVNPKDSPRHAYAFVKARYGKLPLASVLGRLRRVR